MMYRCGSLFSILVLLSPLNNLHGENPLSGLSGSTPPAMAGGTPLGSYGLTDLEHVNLFNGNLNVFVPLRHIDGRGDSDFVVGLEIEKRWYVQRNPQSGFVQATTLSLPVGYSPGYSPGIMYLRQIGSGGPSFCDGLPRFAKDLTRLTFRHSDGTEIEFRDTQTQGQPLDVACSGNSRGTVFASADGSAATFVSDSVITDAALVINGTLNHTFISGTLYWRDGTRYKIGGGVVRSITDRNGNLITLSYGSANLIFDDGSSGTGQRVISIVDSLNRRTDITYADSNGTNPPQDQIIFKGSGGAQRVVRVYRSRLSQTGIQIRTHQSLFPELPDSTSAAFDPLLATAIELPNGQRYQFSYNSYGELTRMVLPSRGAYEYDVGSGLPGSTLSDSGVIGSGDTRQIHRRLRERRVLIDGSTLKGRTIYTAGFSPPPFAQTVTTEELYDAALGLVRRSVHNFHGSAIDPGSYSPDFTNFGYTPWQDGLELMTDIQDGTQTRVRRIRREWEQRAPVPWWTGVSDSAPSNDPRLTKVATELDNGQVAWQQYLYDTYSNRIDEFYTAYGQGSPGITIRHTERGFVTSNNINGQSVDYTFPGIHIRNLPAWEIEHRLDPQTGIDLDPLSFTRFYYDTSGPFNVPNIAGIDVGFGVGYQTRGNLSRVDRTFGQRQITTQQGFDLAGNLVQITPPIGPSYSFEYSDRFGSPDGTTSDAFSPPELGTSIAQAFVTRTVDPQGHAEILQRDYYTGAVVDHSDANGVITTTFSNDALDRPTQVVRANNYPSVRNQTTIAYNDSGRTITRTSDQYSFGDNRLQSSLVYDGMGQTVQQMQFEDGGAAITTYREYDVLGRPTRVSNPQRSSDQAAWTSFLSDVLDRTTQITYPDGAVTRIFFSGDQATSVDPAQKSRISKHDPLGRLIRVQEDPAGLNYTTDYSYDPRGLLTQVAQAGQVRAFSYDSLSRMTSAINPESGGVSYTYDDNNNVVTKTDARGTVTTFGYDFINRLTGKNYSDATPAVIFRYDETNVPFSNERLTTVDNGIAVRRTDEFDPLGRVLRSSQTSDSQTYRFSYRYVIDGSLSVETYPSGRAIAHSYDIAGRLHSVTGNSQATQIAYVPEIRYASHGAIRALQLGNDLWEQTTFNARLQPLQITLGTQNSPSSLLGLTYSFQSSGSDNNGNVRTQTISAPGLTPLNQLYSYDGVNRLSQAVENIGQSSQSWSQIYDYDAFGNRAVRTTSTYVPFPALTPQSLASYDISRNRWNGALYDSSGNIKSDLIRTFNYDAENRQTSVSMPSSATTNYSYDGADHRVQKTAGGAKTNYVYDAFDRLIAEYSNEALSTATLFLTADHLGSVRVTTDLAGNASLRNDYLPFGEEIGSNLGGRATIGGYGAFDGIAQKFRLVRRIHG